MDLTTQPAAAGRLSGVIELYPRALDHLVAEELMPVFLAVLVVGPRGTGVWRGARG